MPCKLLWSLPGMAKRIASQDKPKGQFVYGPLATNESVIWIYQKGASTNSVFRVLLGQQDGNQLATGGGIIRFVGSPIQENSSNHFWAE